MPGLTQVVHRNKEPYDVLIDRSTPWGNPFTHKDTPTRAKFKVATRRESIEAFEEWVLESQDAEAVWIRKNIRQLRGKRLGCWCDPLPCHGMVLAAMANGDIAIRPKQQQLDL